MSLITKNHMYDTSISVFEPLLDKMFTDLFPSVSNTIGINAFKTASYPKCNIVDYADRCEIEAEVAGMSRENISIELENDVLSIYGERRSRPQYPDDATVVLRELKVSSFKRLFRIDSSIYDTDTLSAKYDNGVLTIVIMKRKPEPPRRTKIEVK